MLVTTKNISLIIIVAILFFGIECKENVTDASSFPKYKVAFFSHGGTVSIVDDDGEREKIFAYGRLPRWSPDGNRIVYEKYIKGTFNIYIFNISDTSKTIITNDSAGNFYPQWSPSGEKIVFESIRNRNREIYVSNTDGSSQINLTNTASDESRPQWSHDGTKIIYVSSTNSSNSDIWMMDADGNNKVNLTNGIGRNGSPALSPLGNKIAFISNRDSLSTKVYTMNLNGSEVLKLSDIPILDIPVSWSHDASKIVFGSDIIYTINADGTGRKALTKASQIYYDYSPIWCPDDSKIVFVSTRTHYNDIFVMDSDGKNVKQLSSKTIDNVFPAWSPIKN